MNTAALLDAVKLHARIDHADDDDDLKLMLATSAADIAHAANYDLPEQVSELPEDLQFAIIDHAAMLFDARGGETERPEGLSMAAARVVARHRGVSI